MEVRIVAPDAQGIGEVAVRSKTIMSGYLNEPGLTAESIVDGWLMTADLGRFDSHDTAALRPQKNMIVTKKERTFILKISKWSLKACR